jgi:hypothetical protein
MRSPDEAQRNPGHRSAGGRVDPDCAPLALHPGYGHGADKKEFPPLHPPPPALPYTPVIPSREGALSGPPGPRGRGAAPAPVGARQARRLRGKRTRSSRGSPPPPLRHYDRSAQWGLKKCGMEAFRRRVGAPVRRDFTLQRQAGAPSPLVPSRAQHPGGGSGMGEWILTTYLTLRRAEGPSRRACHRTHPFSAPSQRSASRRTLSGAVPP